MKIIFNLRNVGLGPNGGSLTLIKSANTLAELGNEVIIVDSGKNQCKWCKLNVEHSITKNFPKSDIIIATGFKSYLPTINLPSKHGKKYVWVRGWETWNSHETNIVKIISDSRMSKIVNSIGLQNKLKRFNISSNVIYPGYDFDEIYPLNIRGKDDKIRVGGLNNSRHFTKRSDWIIKSAYILKGIYKNLELWMFGSEKVNDDRIDKYFRQPSIKDKNEFYNMVDIWLSPSCNEGFHMPPAEAMITGCPVIGVNAELSGTKDYLINNITGLTSEDNMIPFMNKTMDLIENKSFRERLGINARKKILEIGDRKKNMKKMVEIFEKDLETC